jgi:hypothetical protein
VSVVHPQANDHKIREPAPIRIVGKVRVDLVGDAPPEIDADAALGAVLRLHRKGRRDLRAHDQAPTLRAVPASGPGLRRLGKHRPSAAATITARIPVNPPPSWPSMLHLTPGWFIVMAFQIRLDCARHVLGAMLCSSSPHASANQARQVTTRSPWLRGRMAWRRASATALISRVTARLRSIASSSA